MTKKCTDLIWAAKHDHDIRKYIYTDNVNEQDECGMTALMWCAFKDNDIDPPLSNEHIALLNTIGINAMPESRKFSGLEDVKCLLEHGASIDIEDESGHTALMWAAFNGHVDTVRYLVENGANIDHKNKRGDTVLKIAELHPHVIDYLNGVKALQTFNTPPPKSKDRCNVCKKKLGLATTFKCRCGDVFCGAHRYSDAHNCGYDYKLPHKRELQKNNPMVVAPKIVKI